MEFQKLLGTRIYLELPEEPKSDLILDEESKAEVMKQKLKTYGRFKSICCRKWCRTYCSWR